MKMNTPDKNHNRRPSASSGNSLMFKAITPDKTPTAVSTKEGGFEANKFIR